MFRGDRGKSEGSVTDYVKSLGFGDQTRCIVYRGTPSSHVTNVRADLSVDPELSIGPRWWIPKILGPVQYSESNG